MTAGPRLRLGISTCLTGERTRYDAGHKYDPCLLEILGPYAEWVPVCPEVEVGLPVPREPMRLEGPPDSPRLMTHHTRQDLTERMGTWAKRRVGELGALGLDGFILKSRSPSCGLFAVPVYDDQGCQTGEGRGLFAAELVRQLSLLPVEEEGRLYAPDRRDNFIERAFAWRRLRGLLQEGPTPGALVAFHTAHKMVLLAHSGPTIAWAAWWPGPALLIRGHSPLATPACSCRLSRCRPPLAGTSTSSTCWAFWGRPDPRRQGRAPGGNRDYRQGACRCWCPPLC